MDYHYKYKKYKKKYLKLTLIRIDNNFQGIKCELNHLSIFSNFNNDDYVVEKTGGNCTNDNYDSYHANATNCGCEKNTEQVLTNFQKPFKFKNSLGDYMNSLLIDNKLEFIGSFDAPSNQMFVCFANLDDESEMNKCPPINTPMGKFNVYFLDYLDHWNINHGSERKWEGAALIIHNNITLHDLDNLLWHKKILYANGVVNIFSVSEYGHTNKLNHPLINYDLPFSSAIFDLFSKTHYKNKYIMFDNGISFDLHENRPRPYIYGTSITGKVLAIFLHTLF